MSVSVTKKIVRITNEYFAKRDDIIFAYLFGSYAKEKQTHLSDIDIAVYIREKNGISDKKLKILMDLSRLLETDDIDLVILNEAPISLLTKILAHKITLNDKSPTIRHSFESLKMRMGFDFSYLEKRILEQRFLNG